MLIRLNSVVHSCGWSKQTRRDTSTDRRFYGRFHRKENTSFVLDCQKFCAGILFCGLRHHKSTFKRSFAPEKAQVNLQLDRKEDSASKHRSFAREQVALRKKHTLKKGKDSKKSLNSEFHLAEFPHFLPILYDILKRSRENSESLSLLLLDFLNKNSAERLTEN